MTKALLACRQDIHHEINDDCKNIDVQTAYHGRTTAVWGPPNFTDARPKHVTSFAGRATAPWGLPSNQVPPLFGALDQNI